MSGKGGKPRRNTGIKGVRPDRKEDKRAEAHDRNDAWAEIGPAKQLVELDRRLGKGVGAKKQRARIAKTMRGAA